MTLRINSRLVCMILWHVNSDGCMDGMSPMATWYDVPHFSMNLLILELAAVWAVTHHRWYAQLYTTCHPSHVICCSG